MKGLLATDMPYRFHPKSSNEMIMYISHWLSLLNYQIVQINVQKMIYLSFSFFFSVGYTLLTSYGTKKRSAFSWIHATDTSTIVFTSYMPCLFRLHVHNGSVLSYYFFSLLHLTNESMRLMKGMTN